TRQHVLFLLTTTSHRLDLHSFPTRRSSDLDRDQELVRRLVPDNIGGLLQELPILPTRKAILLGWASPLPILVEMNELKPEHRPKSDDPDFWDVWTRTSEREVNWKDLADDWQSLNKEEE